MTDKDITGHSLTCAEQEYRQMIDLVWLFQGKDEMGLVAWYVSSWRGIRWLRALRLMRDDADATYICCKLVCLSCRVSYRYRSVP
jgi:hypothetical protein